MKIARPCGLGICRPAVQSAAITACHRRFLIAGQRPGPSNLRCHRTVAVREIERRAERWCAEGFAVGPMTWRDQGEGWPPSLKTERGAVADPDDRKSTRLNSSHLGI